VQRAIPVHERNVSHLPRHVPQPAIGKGQFSRTDAAFLRDATEVCTALSY
jgi:hypothetical protein